MFKKLFSLSLLVLALFTGCNQNDEVLQNSGQNNTSDLTDTKITGSVKGPVVVGYFPSWSETYPSANGTKLINIPEEVTHNFLSFIKPDMRYVKGSYDIKNVGIEVPYDGIILKETVDILKAKGIKVILSIGGETYWGTDDAYNIDHTQIADFVRDFGFDGIDWDYEPNGGFQTIGEPQNVDRFISMIKNSRELLPRSEGYIIACAPAGCGALGRPSPYTQNDDPDSPYAYSKRAEVTGDDISHEYNSTSSQGYTVSLYGFASTGHMIPVFKAAGYDLDLVAFQGYNTGSASQREIMYDSYAYYANEYGFSVAFGMHIPEEPWGPYYTYDEEKLREYTEYVAQGGKHNRAGKGDGVMFWQLLQVSAVNPSLDGIGYSKISYSILENHTPVTTPRINIVTPVSNAMIRENETFEFRVNAQRADIVELYINDDINSSFNSAPYVAYINDLAPGNYILKASAKNSLGELAVAETSIKIIDKNSVEDIPAWKADAVYATPGNKVLHNGKVWSNAWWTQGDEPGKSDVWKAADIDTDSGNGNGNTEENEENGNTGDNNSNNGNNNGNTGDNNGNDNGNNNNSGNGGNTDISEYDPSMTYPTAGTIVVYNGRKYKNKWWVNPGETPGNPNGPWELILENGEGSAPGLALDYDISMAYPTPGTYVNYNGKTYKNKWYVSPGDFPGKDEWGPWELVQ